MVSKSQFSDRYSEYFTIEDTEIELSSTYKSLTSETNKKYRKHMDTWGKKKEETIKWACAFSVHTFLSRTAKKGTNGWYCLAESSNAFIAEKIFSKTNKVIISYY